MQMFFGWKPILLLCCAVLFAQITHSQSGQESPEGQRDGSARPESRPVSRTLTDLGFANGFEQTGQDSSISFMLPMPMDTRVNSARLVLHYASSTMAPPESSMRVSLNGSVRQISSLEEPRGSAARGAEGMTAQRVLSIPLHAEDLAQPFLEVSVRASFGGPQDRCTAQDSNRAFLTILPQTALSYRAQGDSAPSVRGYLSTLPTNARIAIAPGATDEALRATWLLSSELESRGHRVSYADPRDGGDVLIGPRNQLRELNAALPDDVSLGLIRPDVDQPYRFQLVINEPYHVDALAAPWNLLLGSQQYADSTAADGSPLSSETLALTELGFDTDAREFFGSSEWTLATNRIPPGRTPTLVRLDLITPPSSAEDPLSLYVLQDEAVRGMATLDPAGGEQSLTVTLNQSQILSSAPLRILIMRQSSSDCTAAPTAGYVQVLDSSFLRTSANTSTAETIAQFSRTLSGGYSLHLPEDAAEEPQAWGRLLAGVGRSLDLDPRKADLRTTSMSPPDDLPFIWLGQQPPDGFDAPVATNRGRVQVRQRSGEVLLDSGAMPETSMVSLLRNGSQRGLWLRTLGEGIPISPPGLERATGDLVFGDQNGVLVSLATQSDTVVGVAYPERDSWTTSLARYRIWLFALAWAVLTIVVIVVTRRMRKNQR